MAISAIPIAAGPAQAISIPHRTASQASEQAGRGYPEANAITELLEEHQSKLPSYQKRTRSDSAALGVPCSP
jgi:hypothetical protein